MSPSPVPNNATRPTSHPTNSSTTLPASQHNSQYGNSSPYRVEANDYYTPAFTVDDFPSTANMQSSLPHEHGLEVPRGTKRKRLSPGVENGAPPASHLRTDSKTADMNQMPAPTTFAASVLASPMTPGLSITAGSDDSQQTSSKSYMTPQSSNDARRLSVKSLLGPMEEDDGYSFTMPGRSTSYGFDQGRPDLDMPTNDDVNALIILSPNSTFKPLYDEDDDAASFAAEFGFGITAPDLQFEKGGYYANPVPVLIPTCLEPLPATLRHNPMNLLYFHHFLNHTARLLVPHDCPANPFRSVLPQMAVKDLNLLNLLLAYSASHRARLLNHPDPRNRIATLVKDVFPNLRHALQDPDQNVSKSNLATAIMLASLEIISPNAFELPVPWQHHLTIARQMIVARGGYQSLPRTDPGSYFLSRWFAYLDVMGALSGSRYDRPLAHTMLTNSPTPPATSFTGTTTITPANSTKIEGDTDIDCLLGCTSRCLSIVARVATLCQQCDGQRIGLGGVVRKDWQPPADALEAAEVLKKALQDPRPLVFQGCPHGRSEGDHSASAEGDEMIAINDSFHYAALIHLYCRVYGKHSDDAELQTAVTDVVGCLRRTRRGGTAEASMIFPMFTAGCEAQDEAQREEILGRLTSVESYGMTQVRQARTLMQRVWDTGKPWETLVNGEFFG